MTLREIKIAAGHITGYALDADELAARGFHAAAEAARQAPRAIRAR